VIKTLTLSSDNRVFRGWADPAPNCIQGVTVAVYTDGEVAAVMVGLCVARFTSPDKLRELAAGLLATAEQLEAEQGVITNA
jgi:hypothetical protein